ncbi:two-component sensor histidine kinase [Actinoplanes sp. NBRC 14428]|uniref:histidine kinase n=1 Tax=Pseudosporangium ferrugineum TaxID=439699 RepID=A0A2T0RLF2_9ACTN|nr:HAMP domain-containing sensor histidine kinase [Pseudosporangium ferrugineum]PRY21998.1 two-component system sensor histidine kinase BaeS [Pseudosporangium ferrugineum]BCJ50733.1 two-component sensor histidine kinase [Actinoplanes sp. NBRC 14428]
MSRRADARRVPLHRSLITRLLATSVLVAVAAIVATAWLATQSTTRAIQQEQGRSLADDKSVYDSLVAYAATHPDWSEVDALVKQRAAKLNRRITLMTEDRQVITESAPGPSLRAARPSATVDPLALDLALTGGTDRIDPRAVGPYSLPKKERDQLRKIAEVQVECLSRSGVEGEIVDTPSGRPTVRTITVDPKDFETYCQEYVAQEPTRTERKALADLSRRTAPCLGAQAPAEVALRPDFTLEPKTLPRADYAYDSATKARIKGCIEKARKAQLRPYVAPPALLFVTDPDQESDQPVFNLSRTNALRIALVTGAVLIVTVLITILAGRRLVGPLRALTQAADDPADQHARVPVATNDEIGYLARALNDLADRRERSESLRRAMVSDVAHELRTPLTNIRSWLEAAQDGLTATNPALLDLLHEEAVLLQHIIDDLSDLAAADAGNLRVHPEQVYLVDILAQVAEAHRSAAETAGVRLDTDVAGDPQVLADPVRLRQLVGNLVSNGIRYTPSGGSVSVEAAQSDDGLTIAVRDTGIGIAAEDLPKIFDRFWRSDSSRTRATGGSGLGLSIVRQLVEAHGGDITVSSRPNTGTIFTIRLPSPAPRPAPVAPPVAAAG